MISLVMTVFLIRSQSSFERSRPSSSNKLDFEVTVEDADGHTISLKIWSTHSLPFRLPKVTGTNWKTSEEGTGHRVSRHYQLDSTKDLTVTELGPADDTATRLLIVGDTHVGYRHRRRDKKAKGAKDLDARDRFQAVMDQANTLDALMPLSTPGTFSITLPSGQTGPL